MYVVTRDCPIQCLAPLLSRLTYNALVDGVSGSPATVAQVIELYERGRLVDIDNISSGRAGEIRHVLIEAQLIDPSSKPIPRYARQQEASASNGHHVACSHHVAMGDGDMYAVTGNTGEVTAVVNVAAAVD